jgi:glycosyltransferase involved in cell wall biosynthesis
MAGWSRRNPIQRKDLDPINAPLISIVLPVYRESDILAESLAAIRNVMTEQGRFELVVVDDGSDDATWNTLVGLQRDQPELRLLRLSRNFGKESAIQAGLDAARGDAVIVMDADLQHPPALIPKMIELWRQGIRVVEAIKAERGPEPFLRRLSGSIFYRLMSRLSGFNLTGASDFKLLDRSVVDILRQLPERERFFRGLVAWAGFPRAQIPFSVTERSGGQSRWSFCALFRLSMNAVLAFSSFPLHLVTWMGLLTLFLSLLLGIQTLYMYASGKALEGFTTVILLQIILASILMLSLGIIGAYLARIYDAVKGRPGYVIQEERPAKTGQETGTATGGH